MGEALGEATPVGGRPVLHGARRRRKGCSFAETKRDARNEQRQQAGHEAGRDGGERPDQPAPEQGLARPKAVSDPAADYLEQQIGIGKGREYQPELRVAQTEFFLDFTGRRADVDPVDIGDEVHDAQHRQHDMRGLEPKPHISSRFAFYLLYCFNGCAEPMALTVLMVCDPVRFEPPSGAPENLTASALPAISSQLRRRRPMRHARSGETHLDAGQGPNQRQFVALAEVTNAKHLAGELAQTGAERHVVGIEHGLAELVGVVPRRHQHSRQHR